MVAMEPEDYRRAADAAVRRALAENEALLHAVELRIVGVLMRGRAECSEHVIRLADGREWTSNVIRPSLVGGTVSAPSVAAAAVVRPLVADMGAQPVGREPSADDDRAPGDSLGERYVRLMARLAAWSRPPDDVP